MVTRLNGRPLSLMYTDSCACAETEVGCASRSVVWIRFSDQLTITDLPNSCEGAAIAPDDVIASAKIEGMEKLNSVRRLQRLADDPMKILPLRSVASLSLSFSLFLSRTARRHSQ